jgi:hypothetical protein
MKQSVVQGLVVLCVLITVMFFYSRYQLVAILRHQGNSASSGHYVVEVKQFLPPPPTAAAAVAVAEVGVDVPPVAAGSWWRFDDQHVVCMRFFFVFFYIYTLFFIFQIYFQLFFLPVFIRQNFYTFCILNCVGFFSVTFTVLPGHCTRSS